MEQDQLRHLYWGIDMADRKHWFTYVFRDVLREWVRVTYSEYTLFDVAIVLSELNHAVDTHTDLQHFCELTNNMNGSQHIHQVARYHYDHTPRSLIKSANKI
jgi:hypothetical protein